MARATQPSCPLSFSLGLCGFAADLQTLTSLIFSVSVITPNRRDFSKATNQFNLHKHLTASTPRDRRNGVENSRRLARNAIRLGTADEKHREVSIVFVK